MPNYNKGNAISIFVTAGVPYSIYDQTTSTTTTSKLGSTSTTKKKTRASSMKTAMGLTAVYFIATTVFSSAMQALNAYVSHMGDLTGQMQTQRNTQFALSMVQQYGSAIMRSAIGFMSNPIFGGASLVMSAISISSSLGIQNWENQVENAKSNYNASIVRARSGLSTIYGNGRNTEK